MEIQTDVDALLERQRRDNNLSVPKMPSINLKVDPEIAAMRPLNQMAWMMTAATAASSPM